MSLVDVVVAKLEAAQQQPGGKPRRRGAVRKAAIRNTVAAIIGNLLRAWAASPALPVFRSLKAEGFTGAPVCGRVFSEVMKGLQALGYVWRKKGYKRKGETGTGRGSRFWPSHILLRLAAEHGVDRDTVREDFVRVHRDRKRLPRKVRIPIVLKALKPHPNSRIPKRLKVDPSDPIAAAFIMDVTAHNEFAASVAVEGCAQPAWRREFKADLAASLYGRWHAIGDGNYQSMSEAERLLLRFGGEPVAEIDISGSFLTLMHGLFRLPAPETDPYLIGDLPRKAVKAWITGTLGKGTPVKAWPKAKSGTQDGSAVPMPPAAAVGEAVIARYPFLREPWRAAMHLERYGDPRRLLFHMLTGLEAAIVTTVMQALRERGILALPMHDGLIVPMSAVNLAHDLLLEAGERFAKVRLRLTVDHAPAWPEA